MSKSLTKEQMYLLASRQVSGALAAGFTPAELRAAGFTLAELLAAGFTPAELRAAGFTPAELLAAGFTPAELRAAGFTPAELLAAGFTPAKLRAAGFTPAELRAAGFTPAKLRAAGFTPAELRAAGFTKKEIDDFEATIPLVEKPYTKILDGIRSRERLFNQGSFGPDQSSPEFNLCGSAMCTGGHLVSLGGAAGWKLKEKFDYPIAASLIHYKAHPNLPPQDFDAIPDAWALAYIEHMAEIEAKQ